MRYAPHRPTHAVSCHAGGWARDPRQRATVLKSLRQRIAQIEGRVPAFGAPLAGPSLAHSFATPDPHQDPHEDGGVSPRKTPPSTSSSSLPFPSAPNASMDHRPVAAWTFGEAFLDHAIGPTGLAADSVHEIKPGRLPLTASAGDGTEPMGDAAPLPDWSGAWGAARLLALTLAIRRLALLRDQNPDAPQTTLWCQPAHASRDLGAFYAPGLAQIGLPPENLIIVETRRSDETLWTLEEALRAGSLALVIGQLDAVDLTPARRLALAAQQHGTPCLLLTHPDSPSAAATASAGSESLKVIDRPPFSRVNR